MKLNDEAITEKLREPLEIWANEAFFQIMMLVYNIFLLFKMDKVSASEYRQWILTFRLKYVFVGKPVSYIDDVCGPAARDKIRNLENGQILMLENVRFMAEEMTLFETKLNLTPEEQAKTLVVRKLALLSNLYVCDAFAAAHRSQPTLVGMEEVLPSAMGRLLEKEITSFTNC